MGHQDQRMHRRDGTVDATTTALEAASVQIAQLTVGFAELTASAGSQAFPFAAALPAGAAILGVGLDVTAGFVDAGVGVFTADLGIDGGDADAYLDGADIAAIAKVDSPRGVSGNGLAGAKTPELLILADVNVDTATAGEVTAQIYYVDTALL